jgi:acyl-CoA hydrolase/GNAT superfamily N-acetyltransferase
MKHGWALLPNRTGVLYWRDVWSRQAVIKPKLVQTSPFEYRPSTRQVMEQHHRSSDYRSKVRTADEAIRQIRSGKRIFIGSSCGEPMHLVNALVRNASSFSDLEIVRLMSSQSSPLSLIANQSAGNNFTIRSIYQGSAIRSQLAEVKRYIAPMNLFAVPDLFRQKQIALHAALIQVAPPDEFGWMSLGVSVDITLAAAQSADLVIAQVNPQMPRILGYGFIHLNEVDVIVEHDEAIFTIDPMPESDAAHTIGKLVGNLIDDGSTIQMGLGNTPQSILIALSEKNDLGVHSQFLLDDMMVLSQKGVITNRKKGLHNGKMVASSAIGSRTLYRYLHNNPSVSFFPSDYVNNPRTIAQNNRMVAINVAMGIDFTGQVAAEVLPKEHYSGVTGLLDFVRGATLSKGGKSIILISSTNDMAKTSRFVPTMEGSAVVIPRSDVQYVISEFGAVNLFGKSLQERTMAMISLAHPDFRQELLDRAKEMGLLARKKTLADFMKGVYPAYMEETREIDGQSVRFRAAKPVDGRRIQEHFYNLTPDDIQSRFFHEKSSFLREDMKEMFQIDYKKDLTVVAVTGEFGFGRVIGMGAYLMARNSTTAEVAFSVSKEWQGKGIAGILMKKLYDAALKNGVDGFIAFTSHTNAGMIGLFKKLPCKTTSVVEDELLVLDCRFGDLL